MSETPISPRDLVLLADELEAVFRARIPLAGGLQQAAGRWRGRLRATAERLAGQIEAGAPLVETLEAASDLPPAFRTLLISGLQTGQADRVLSTFARAARQEVRLRETVVRGLMYPVTIVVLAFFLFVGLIWWLYPNIQQTFDVFRLGNPLWLRTGASLRATVHWWSWLVPVGVLTAALLWWRTAAGAHGRSAFRIPWDGKAGHYFQLATASELLAQLIDAQVPLPVALKLTGETLASSRIRQALIAGALASTQGRPAAEVLARNPSAPPLWRSLFASSGGDSEALAAGLRLSARSYGYRASRRAELVGRWLPMIGLCLVGGGIVLAYSLALFFPLTQLWTALGAAP